VRDFTTCKTTVRKVQGIFAGSKKMIPHGHLDLHKGIKSNKNGIHLG
jgi:hypothetical protein